MSRKQKGQAVGGQFVPLLYQTLDCPAWRDLSATARLVYIDLKRKGRPETNGQVFLSIRDAAEAIGISRNTVQTGFRDLQSHGFIVATTLGHLGAAGQGKATTWRLTELAAPGSPRPTKEYLQWSPGVDFEVQKAPPPPHRKQKPVPIFAHPCPKNRAVSAEPVPKTVPPCPNFCDVSADTEAEPVPIFGTHLESTRGRGLR
jgi:hypothetical protein